MKLTVALASLALAASVASAAPTTGPTTSCAASYLGATTMQCSCLAQCTATDRCCPDYAAVSSKLQAALKSGQTDPSFGRGNKAT